MQEITLHNYEAYLLDYSEGNLNVKEIEALNTFLALHPELGVDPEITDLPTLTGEPVSFQFKEALKKDGADLVNEELLNYLEGNLLSGEIAAFEKRLAEDPDLTIELEGYRKTILTEDKAFFENKKSLLKTEDDLILNNQAIAYAEDQLSASERKAFEFELKTNAELQKELSLIFKAKAVANEAVIYPDKEELKKEARAVALFSFRTVSIAAAILFLIGFVFLFDAFHIKTESEMKLANKADAAKTTAPSEAQTSIIKSSGSNNKREITVKTISSLKKSADKSDNHIAGSSAQRHSRFSKQEQEKQIQSENSNGEAVKKDLTANKNDIASTDNAQNKNIISVPENNAGAKAKEQKEIAADSLHSEDAGFVHQTFLATEEDEQEEASTPAAAKKGFWHRMVSVAKGANKLGVKSISAEEKANNDYVLSFHSFSVEKK